MSPQPSAWRREVVQEGMQKHFLQPCEQVDFLSICGLWLSAFADLESGRPPKQPEQKVPVMSISTNYLSPKVSVFRGTESRGLTWEDSNSLESASSEDQFSGRGQQEQRSCQEPPPLKTTPEIEKTQQGQEGQTERGRGGQEGTSKTDNRTGVPCNSERRKRSKWESWLYTGASSRRGEESYPAMTPSPWKSVVQGSRILVPLVTWVSLKTFTSSLGFGSISQSSHCSDLQPSTFVRTRLPAPTPTQLKKHQKSFQWYRCDSCICFPPWLFLMCVSST